ncbi:MAG: MTH1187 family thiamine-binding protein [Humidesulfovibrio sp.]|uniref:MTH1187 family thiamine-binding protein n=1 Tax=Humidesulfovibrio sp. TaxID=2910988 RepID=UPI0027FA13C2|nr:MTH1187 family thiamine-binding protein [Humidesulfovibrio sp.]MDQ7835318.1 MTH1187 family thiamine-binding protein [Humidesulfovibrio sp.]
MSVIAELSLFPMDKGQSVGAHVARAVRIIRESGLACQLTPMGTCIEGEWDEVMAVVDKCFQAMAEESDRVYLTLKADWRRGREHGMSAKTESVERALAEAGAKVEVQP